MDWKKNSDKKFLRISKKKPKKTTNLVKRNKAKKPNNLILFGNCKPESINREGVHNYFLQSRPFKTFRLLLWFLMKNGASYSKKVIPLRGWKINTPKCFLYGIVFCHFSLDKHEDDTHRCSIT